MTDQRIQAVMIDRVKPGVYVKESSFPVVRYTAALVAEAIITRDTARNWLPETHLGMLIHDGTHPALKSTVDMEELSSSSHFAQVRRQRSATLIRAKR
jgi:hypothetical protein